MSRTFVFLTGIALALASPGGRAADPPPPGKYSFQINGEAFTPEFIHLEGTADRPADGDLFDVWYHFRLPVGPDRKQSFEISPEDDTVLWSLTPGGRRRPAAVAVKWHYTDEKDADGWNKRVLVNPLAKLTPDEIRGLRCVYLDAWGEGLADALRHLDPDRACMVVSGYGVEGEDRRRLAPLPAGLKYLVIQEDGNVAGIKDYRPLAELKALRYLTVNTMVAPFDCGLLRGAKDLAHLRINAPALRNPEAVADLGGLRHLDLRYNRDLTTVAFAARLPHLETLRLSRTAVTDLAPLAGHPGLRTIEADTTPLRQLPLDRPLPALRTIDLLSTKVSAADAAAFAKLNPQCAVARTWEGKLTAALAGATRLRVRTGGTCHRDRARERTLFEVKDAAQVRALLGLVKINERTSGPHCMCCGEPSFEFYAGDALILTVGYHHGIGLRWIGGWPGDGMLTAASADALKGWLAGRIPAIKLQQEAERAQAAREGP
jgi:hypothetical protein